MPTYTLTWELNTGRKEDIARVDIPALSDTEFGRVLDADQLMRDFLEYPTTTSVFFLNVEYEFELLEQPLLAASYNIPTRTLFPPRSEAVGMPAARSQTAGTPAGSVVPKQRKSATNTMLAELDQRTKKALEKQATEGIVQPSLVFKELSHMWKCNEGSRCKNYRNGQQFAWCYIPEGEKNHYPLTSKDLVDWAYAIRANKTTAGNPPGHFFSKGEWQLQRSQQQQHTIDPSGQSLQIKGRRGRYDGLTLNFPLNIQQSSNSYNNRDELQDLYQHRSGGSLAPSTWRASSTAAREPQLPQWSSHAASQWNGSRASGSSSQFDLPCDGK